MTIPPVLLRTVSRGLAIARTRPARWAFGLFAVGLAVWALVSEREQVLDAVGRLSVPTLLYAVLATVLNLVCAGMLWRTVLADLGSRLPLTAAARVFFIGQLGKYLPGSVWPVVMQAELGRDHQVPRTRTATATVVMMLLGVATALLVVLLAVPFAPNAVPDGFGWAVLLVIPLLVALHPSVLGFVADKALSLAGRGGLERRPTVKGMAAATLWGVASWVGAGLQVWALVTGLGAQADPGTFALATGGYALAWAVGFVVVVAPAGAGAREVALAAVLSGVLDRGGIVVVVLISRVLFTLGDLTAAGLALLGGHPAAPSPVNGTNVGKTNVGKTDGGKADVGKTEAGPAAQAPLGSGESVEG